MNLTSSYYSYPNYNYRTVKKTSLNPMSSSAPLTMPSKGNQKPKFGGWLNAIYNSAYNKVVAEPIAGYKKIEDSKGELQSPAGDTSTLSQDRKKSTYNNFNFYNAGLKKVDFTDSKFSHGTNFQKSVCEAINFSNCDMPSVNFEGSVLNGSDFSNANLTGANFSNCDLETLNQAEEQFWKNVTDRHGENLYAITTKAFSYFANSRVYHSSFENADLVGANFAKADLRGVNFKNANLRHANFEQARIQDADLTGARLLGAKFKDAHLKGAKINLMDALEREIRSGNNQTQAYINLGELLHTSSLKLNIHDPKTANQIHELFEARDKGLITQSQLETSFKKHLEAGERQHLPVPQMFPYAFDKAHQDLL